MIYFFRFFKLKMEFSYNIFRGIISLIIELWFLDNEKFIKFFIKC